MSSHLLLFFFFSDTEPTDIYTLSLHDALPILLTVASGEISAWTWICMLSYFVGDTTTTTVSRMFLVKQWYGVHRRSEEHTSELQSQSNLVCRLLLEKKKTTMSTKPQTRSMTCF